MFGAPIFLRLTSMSLCVTSHSRTRPLTSGRHSFLLSLVLAAGFALAPWARAAATSWQVDSPDGRIRAEVRSNEAGGLSYRVLRLSAPTPTLVLDWSALGVVKAKLATTELAEMEKADFSRTVSVTGQHTRAIEEKYELVTGKRLKNTARAAELALDVTDIETKATLRLEFRAYPEGVVFRYVFTGQSVLQHWLTEETTEFNVGPGGTHWGQPYDKVDMWKPAYETPYTNGLPSGTAADPAIGTGWGFPLLFQQRGLWCLLHESGLTPQSHGSHLQPQAPGGVYRIAFPLAEEAMGFGRTFPASTLPWALPWRLVHVGDNLAQIVESNLVFHVAEPSRLQDTSWIKPGLSSWSWWSDHDSSRSLPKLKDFIDVASEMGWPYSLVDANWNLIAPDAMDQLVAHANTKRVQLLFWYNSGGRHNFVTEEPRNIMAEPALRRAEFAKLRRLGVKGVKVDFFQSDKQDIIQQYFDILEDAAAAQIMVVTHGCAIPRGWQRTYPHLMAMESVRGAETYTFPSQPHYGQLAPAQNTVIAFTRNVIGSMDYTPVSFTQQSIERFTTPAHEAALGIIFESGIQHVSEAAAGLRKLPPPYRDYLRGLPVAWEETRLLAGYPSRDVVLARRAGGRWYIGGINGEKTAKTLTFPVDALGLAGRTAQLLHDGPADAPFGAKSITLPKSGNVSIDVSACGGFVLLLP